MTYRAIVLTALLGAACTPPPVTTAPGPAPITRASLRASIDQMVAAPEFRSAHFGILIVDPLRADTLYSLNAGKLFMPASNQKILTGAVALAKLGPDYRFSTTFAARGAVRDSVLDGDLLIYGTGDPSLSDRMRGDAMMAMREIADSLATRGIRRITGRALPAGDALPGSIHGFGWSYSGFDAAYSAGVDELFFNEGFARVVARGGAMPGDSATVYTTPSRRAARIRSEVVTGAREPMLASNDTTMPMRPRSRINASTDRMTGEIVVTGTVLPGDSVATNIAHFDPASAYVEALQEAMAERGITVQGQQRDTLARVDTLFTILSPPLAEILPPLQKPSQNQIAEIVYRTLGREITGVGSPDSARRVVEAQLAEWGAEEDGYAVRDGSGLSRHNYVTPETIARVLHAMMRDTSTFRIFYDAMPIAGVDGTISGRMRGTPAQGNVRAKTGFIDKARALSGYVTTADGRTLIFVVIGNNFTTPVRAVEQVQDAIAVQLASMNLGG